jgi:hypothetical protein
MDTSTISTGPFSSSQTVTDYQAGYQVPSISIEVNPRCEKMSAAFVRKNGRGVTEAVGEWTSPSIVPSHGL